MSSAIKKIIVWLLMVIALALAFKYYEYQQKQSSITIVDANQEIVLQRWRGHYYWPARIEQQEIIFMLDTGATATALPQSFVNKYLTQAKKHGFAMVTTANGTIEVPLIKVDIEFNGGLTIRQLNVVVLPPSAGDTALLGMDVLSKFNLQQTEKQLKITFKS